MTFVARREQRLAQQRGFPINQGGWGGLMGDPAAIPPPSAYNMATAGVVVNERTVLTLMVVASCIRILGDTAGGIQPRVYRMTGSIPRPEEDKQVDPPPVIAEPYADIHREDGDFRRIAALGLNGNVYSHVVDRDRKGDPSQVEVLNPALLKPELKEGRKIYKIGAAGQTIPAQDIVHTPWLSLSGGLIGLNPIEIGVAGFGIPLAAQEFAGRYYAQGMHPTGILSVQKLLRPEDSKRLKEELATQHGGISQAFAPIVLDADAKWQQISITPETAQLIQSRAFSRGEIAGFYGLPGWLVNDTPDNGGPWGKGLQEMSMGFAVYHLSGYTRRLDRADTALLPAGYYVRRNVKEIFKTNDQMLGQFLNMLRMGSIASPNEARELAGMPRSDEPAADSLFAPINSAHSDFLAAGGYGAESGLPGALNPKGAPVGTVQGGEPTEPEGGQ